MSFQDYIVTVGVYIYRSICNLCYVEYLKNTFPLLFLSLTCSLSYLSRSLNSISNLSLIYLFQSISILYYILYISALINRKTQKHSHIQNYKTLVPDNQADFCKALGVQLNKLPYLVKRI